MAVSVARFVDPSGSATILSEGPVIDKFSSGRTKLEVAPESSTMVDDVLSSSSSSSLESGAQ